MFVRDSPRRSIVAGGISVALILAGASLGGEYRDRTGHFSFRIPTHWSSLPSSFVDMMNDAMAQSVPEDGVQFQGGFGRSDGVAGSYPYVLLQVVTGSNDGDSYERIEQVLGVDEPVIKLEGPISDVIKNYSVGTMVLDRSKNRLVMHIVMEVEGVGTVRGLTVGFLGKNLVVFLHCYAPDADFTRHITTFNVILDSFQFDPGFAFVSIPEGFDVVSPPKKSVPERLINVGMIAAFAGAGAAVIMFLLGKLARRAERHREKGKSSDHYVSTRP